MRTITKESINRRKQRLKQYDRKNIEFSIFGINTIILFDDKVLLKERILDIVDIILEALNTIVKSFLKTIIAILDLLFCLFIVLPLGMLYIVFFKILMLDNIYINKIIKGD